MADGLMGLSNLLGQSSNSSSLLGGGIFSQPKSRGERRSQLLSDVITAAGSNPYARLGASFGGLIGMGTRAGAEGLGIVDQPEEVKRNKAISQVQEEVRQKGIDPMENPAEFGEYVSNRFSDLGYNDLALRTQIQIQEIMPEAQTISRVVRGGTPEGEAIGLGAGESAVVEFEGGRVKSIKDRSRQDAEGTERRIRLVGGTERAKALAERYPEIGSIAKGQEAFLTLSNGEFRDIETKSAPENDTPSRIREYEIALERGLISPNTTLEQYNQLRAGGQGRETITPTETRIDPFLNTIESNSELDEQISNLAPKGEPRSLFGFDIPFTGRDTKDVTKQEVAIRAAEIREGNAQLTLQESVQRAIDELSKISGMSVPRASEGSQTGSDPFADVTE